jgi:hypothetical protein
MAKGDSPLIASAPEESESQQSPRSARLLLHLSQDAVIDQLGDVLGGRLQL